jgi:uncharacterized protein YeeX (DUF496 family)
MVTEYYNYQVLELGVRNHQEQVEYLKKLIEYHKDKARKDAIDEVIEKLRVRVCFCSDYNMMCNYCIELNKIAKEMQK